MVNHAEQIRKTIEEIGEQIYRDACKPPPRYYFKNELELIEKLKEKNSDTNKNT